MNIYTVAFAYGLADDLLRSVEARAANNVTTILILHSRRPDVVAVCERLAARPDVIYWPYGENRGMARSVNEAIIYAEDHSADAFMSINDDVIVGPDDVQRLATTRMDHPDCA